MTLTPEMLQPLRYPRAWIEFGLLDEALVRSQLDAYQRAEDRCTEHFRWSAFQALLARATFEDLLVERFLNLAEQDPDPVMARAAVLDLMEHPGLSDDQLEQLARCTLSEPRFLARSRLLRALQDGEPTPDLLRACLDSKEQRVHRVLLKLPGLTRDSLRQLAKCGATRAVRNEAAERLRHL